jgi:single-strand DNA-binding protein
VNITWKDGNGAKQEHTEWVNCAIWGKFGETMAQYLKKGGAVFVAGEPRTRAYDDRDGVKRYTTTLNVRELCLLGDSKPREGSSQHRETRVGQGYGQPSGRNEQRQTEPPADEYGGVDMGDIPFRRVDTGFVPA